MALLLLGAPLSTCGKDVYLKEKEMDGIKEQDGNKDQDESSLEWSPEEFSGKIYLSKI